MSVTSPIARHGGVVSLFLLPGLMASESASAHVKWFAKDIDCGMQPQSVLTVLGSFDFMIQAAIFLVVMVAAGIADRLASDRRSGLNQLTTRVDRAVVSLVPDFLRCAVAIFFVCAVWFYGVQPVYLTPELKAYSPLVPILQLSISMCLLFRKMAWLGALGIGFLYAAAVFQYGWFHLLDYPIFLAVAAFIAIDSLCEGKKTDTALAVLRVGAGITLMWAGGEKWLYPWWSYGMVERHLSGVRFGLDDKTFMYLCGFVEFCAAYALVFGRQITQWAAAFLLIPFVAAIPVFGPVDAIGHAPIIVVLLILGGTKTRLSSSFLGRTDWIGSWNFAFSSIVGVFFVLGIYWLLHDVAYPRVHQGQFVDSVVALLIALPALMKILQALVQLSDVQKGMAGQRKPA